MTPSLRYGLLPYYKIQTCYWSKRCVYVCVRVPPSWSVIKNHVELNCMHNAYCVCNGLSMG